MRVSRIGVLFVLLTTTVPRQSPAQKAKLPATPEAVARAALAAVDSAQWPALLALVHPMALAGFRAQQLEMLRSMSHSGPGNGDEVGVVSPRRESFADFYVRRVFLAYSVNEVKSLHADTLLLRYLTYIGDAWRSRPDSARAPASRRFLGTVIDGDSVAYVMIRTAVPDSPNVRPDQVEFLTLRRLNGKWRTMLDGGLVFGSDGTYGFSVSDEDEAVFDSTSRDPK